MSLILCHLHLDVVIQCEGKTLGEIGELAKRFANDEIRNGIRVGSCELVTSVEQLPEGWRSSLPYRESHDSWRSGWTCRQILEVKS